MSVFSARPDPASASRTSWDVVVVGGGIIGAGVFREACRLGLRTLLVERDDFASGTSSRSSKLVHGGLRYLPQGEIRLVRRALEAKRQLLTIAPGLIDPLEFVVPLRGDDTSNRWKLRLGLFAYDLLAGARPARHELSGRRLLERIPSLNPALGTGFTYGDAQTDDARLVLRVIREGCDLGGRALSYAPVERIIRDEDDRVSGVWVRDDQGSGRWLFRCHVVVNAAGPWGDELRRDPSTSRKVRRVRGSHLVFSPGRPSLPCAVAGMHPTSGLPICAMPWLGVTLVGTTHDEESGPPNRVSQATPSEIEYLLEGARALFPAARLGLDDVQAVFAGVRPIADQRTSAPGLASRGHLISYEAGMVRVVGGKLTTFHSVALEVADRLRRLFPGSPHGTSPPPPLGTPPSGLDTSRLGRVRARSYASRYGPEIVDALNRGSRVDRRWIPELGMFAGELKWIAQNERVEHLDDLMLRRTRLGIIKPKGGLDLLPRVRSLTEDALRWTGERWTEEMIRYRRIWEREHALPMTVWDSPRRRTNVCSANRPAPQRSNLVPAPGRRARLGS